MDELDVTEARHDKPLHRREFVVLGCPNAETAKAAVRDELKRLELRVVEPGEIHASPMNAQGSYSVVVITES